LEALASKTVTPNMTAKDRRRQKTISQGLLDESPLEGDSPLAVDGASEAFCVEFDLEQSTVPEPELET
jgi:hypothetical protein